MTSDPLRDLSLTAQASVSIVRAKPQANPPAWHLEYDVLNAGPEAMWLVVDEELVLKRDGARIELSYARARMRPGVKVFGYFDPQVVEIPPGGSVRRSVEITWPCPLSDVWNAEREATPPPGDYEVSVRVGFATTPTIEPPQLGESVEAPVLNWQKEAASAPVRIPIPPYALRGGRVS